MENNEVLSILSQADETAFKQVVEEHNLIDQTALIESWRNLACQRAFAGREKEAVQIAALILKISNLHDNEAILALSNWTYGNIYTITDKATEALTHYKLAELFYLKSGNALDLARMRVGVVGVFNKIGRYKEACRLAEESWPLLARSSESGDQRRLAGLANNLGVAYEYLGRYEEALKLYERKIALWQKRPTTPQSDIEIARTRINIGVLKKRFNLLVEAQRELQAGKEMLISRKASANYRLDLIRAELHLVELYESLDVSPQEIRRAQTTVEATAVGLNDLLNLKIAQTGWQLNHPQSFREVKKQLVALKKNVQDSTRDAIKIDMLLARYAFSNGNVNAAIKAYQTACDSAIAIKDWELHYVVQHDLGRLYLQTENLPAATQALTNAIHVIEQTQQKLSCQELRSIFIDDKLAVYRDLIHTCLLSKKYDIAFHWLERARARELVQTLASRATTFYKPKHVIPAIEVQSHLPPDTLLLTFSFIKDRLWAIPQTRAGFLEPRLLTNIPSQAKLEQALSWLRMPVKLPATLIQQRTPMLIAAAKETLATLYQQFLEPLEDWLQQYSKLVIVPDGYLFHLPFACLYNANGRSYLAETHQVRLIPSNTAWHLNKNKSRRQNKSVAFAYSGNGNTLAHTNQEVKSICEVNQDFVVFSGNEATIQKFHGDLVKNAKYIHLASHAIFRQDNPLFSYVELANGPLKAQEILSLKLNASLVVLSACETGRGFFRGGDYWGLANAFLLAGAKSILATHWRVDDGVTANIMKDFYDNLANHHSKIDALRQAQLGCINHKDTWRQHPFYWAPFFLVG